MTRNRLCSDAYSVHGVRGVNGAGSAHASAQVFMGADAGALTAWVPIGESTALPTVRVNVPMAQSGDKALSGVAAGVTDGPASVRVSTQTIDDAMDRYSGGDDAAFEQLYRYAAPRVRGFLLGMCGDPAAAEDLVQETLFRVSRARANFERGAAAWPWILAIARNTFLDASRRAQTRARSLQEASPSLRPLASPEARGDEMLAGRELLSVVRSALAKLKVHEREAFVLVRYEGLTVKEAAKVVGSTEGAVKIRAFRAYQALRAAIDKYEKGVR